MCGIAGQVNFSPEQPVEAARLAAMAKTLARRGPDAEGVWTEGSVGLCHRRLSVIDLSAAANQPMANEDGTVHIVYNGEIYNFRELRAELERKGHVFRSRSDTEVLIHLYEDLGTAMLGRVAGMFAFAIWDARRRRLFAARDRVGMKPFKYCLDNEKFVFASELKAILARGDVAAEIDDEVIHQYLGFGYVFAPNTGFRQIRKLPPAHYLLLEDGRLRIERYWRLNYRNKTLAGYEECQAGIVEALDEAVRARLVADVPLGVMLSGGVDSSAIVALMSRHTSPVRTFSIGFGFQRHNELPYARRVAQLFATEHTEHVVHAKAAEILPELVYLYEEPYADSSALPSYLLAQVTRRSVTVALNGDGGDENFCGYERYNQYVTTLRALRFIERWRADWLLSIARGLPGSFFGAVARRAKVMQGLLRAPLTKVYGRVICQMCDELKAELYTAEFRRWIAERPNHSFMNGTFGSEAAGQERLEQALLWDLENYLTEDLCAKMDIATMAHGLEARSPYLDHRFLEYCASIPLEWKYYRGEKKHILKEALGPILPADIIHRRKHGFAVPIHEWFRGELAPLCRDALTPSDSKIQRYIDAKALRRRIDSHVSGASDEGYRLWMLLVLELWLRMVAQSAS